MTSALSLPFPGGSSPRTMARLAGVLYLATIVAGMVAQMAISGRMIVPGDSEATAAAIQAGGSLYRMGYTFYLIEMASHVIMTVLLYRLLRPVDRSLAQVGMVLSLTGCGIKTVSRLFYLAPVLVLGGAPFLGVFAEEQRHAMALLFAGLNDLGAGIALPFFGLGTLIEGVLILRSTFLPRTLGIIGILGGLGWLTYFVPTLGNRAFPVVVGVALLGALCKIGWLLVKGVDEEPWKVQAQAAAVRAW